MINNMEYIPVTATSHPFARAAVRCEFDKCGYIEDEYFISGTANVYDEDAAGAVSVIYPDAPYINRMLVRRPAAGERFSGNIVVEILNPSAMMDIDRMWVFAWKYFVSHGDIYIGITSKPDVLKSLYTFDNERYSRINWNNPLPGRELPVDDSPFPKLAQYEAGLFWDMLTDLARLLRTQSPLNPLAQYGNAKLYLTGWSQSGGYMVRYRETFAGLPENNIDYPIFDGYLEAGLGSIPCPINTFSKAMWPIFSTRPGFKGIIKSSEPYIAVNTESENEHTCWKGDSTKPGELFRCYEIPGSSHDSKYNLLDYYEGDVDTLKTGTKPYYYGLEPYPIDYPYEFVMSAVFRNLFVWVREGVPAPASKQIVIGEDGKNTVDIFGNAVGGVRTPFIDLPTCLYSKYCTLKEDPSKTRDFFGHIEPFSPGRLKALYLNLVNYRELVVKRTDELIAEGYLLLCDREEIINLAVGFAKERGLTE